MTSSDAKLKAKLIQLKLTADRTENVLKTEQPEAIERHLKALKTIVTEADQYRREEETAKIVAEEDIAQIGEWNAEIEVKLAQAEQEIKRLKTWNNEYNWKLGEDKRNQELEFEQKLFETRLKFQTELQQAKATQEAELTKSSNEATVHVEKTAQAKLPKLVITKFNGTYLDWPRFWEQFKETVDKTSVEPVIKLTYLRELLEPKVRKTIEALPFTSEGYNRAMSILQERFGKESEIIKAYSKQIFDLPTINDLNVNKIHEFTDKLTYAVQSLETLGKLSQVNGNVAMTLDKLPAIRGDLVRTDESWESWDFVKLTEALRLWTRRNPVERRSGKLLTARQEEPKVKECVYCEGKTHKSTECTKVASPAERREILKRKRLCYNCTSSAHRVSECQSWSKCKQCDRRHHTSICEQKGMENKEKGKTLLISTEQNTEGIFPVVQIKVDGVKCRALIDLEQAVPMPRQSLSIF